MNIKKPEKLTESQILEMRTAVFQDISKKCLIEDLSPKDFLGHKYEFPVLDGGRFVAYEFVVSHELISAFERMVSKTIKEMEKRVLNGKPGSKPKGLLNNGRNNV